MNLKNAVQLALNAARKAGLKEGDFTREDECSIIIWSWDHKGEVWFNSDPWGPSSYPEKSSDFGQFFPCDDVIEKVITWDLMSYFFTE